MANSTIGDNGVVPDRSVIARAAVLLLLSAFLAAIALAGSIWSQNSIYRLAGGEIRQADPNQTFRDAVHKAYPRMTSEELDKTRGFKKGTTLYISRTAAAYWVSQAFVNGWVQCAILYGFLTGLLYTIGVCLGQLIPGWHLSSAPRRFREIARQMAEMRKTGVKNIEEIIERIDGNDRFADRLHKLQQHYLREPNRQLCREANKAYSRSEQVEAIYVMLPLGLIEFLLPVFGFIGTVLGVIDAVAGLRSGMSRLFQDGALTPEVMNRFMAGFDGLVLAFMTTLFGLLGLALMASFRFHLRRNAMAVIAKIDEWSEEAINLLPHEDLLERIAEALFEEDENGQRTPRLQAIAEALIEEDENGQRVARLHRLGKLIREAMFKPTEDSEEPVPILPRAQESLQHVEKLLDKGLFEPSEKGDGRIPALRVVRSIIHRIHSALMHHIYQIVGEDDRNQYTTLIVDTWDEETGETHSMEVQGRYRLERQHAETLAWMRILTDGIIDAMRKPPPPSSPGRGFLIISPNGEPVHQIAASTAAVAVVRDIGDSTADSELISGCYKAVSGQMLALPDDRLQLLMAIKGLGFSARAGTEANLFSVYTPFAPIDPWQQHGAKQLLPTKPLVRCDPAFLRGHDVLSADVAFVKVNELTWLLFLAREVSKDKAGQIGLFGLPLEGENHVPQQVGEFVEGELTAEAVFQGKAYAFALRNGQSTNVVVAYSGEGKPVIRCIKGDTEVTALAFDADGALRYAAEGGKTGTVIVEKGSLQNEYRLDRAGQIVHLAYSSNKGVHAAVRDSAELLLVRMDADGKQPKTVSVVYPRLITTVTASPDGKAVFVGLADGSVYQRNG